MHKFEYFFLNEEASEAGSGSGFNQATATPEEIAQRLAVSEGSFIEADKEVKVDIAETASKAKESLSKKYDIIFLDIGLPDKDGVTILGVVKELR